MKKRFCRFWSFLDESSTGSWHSSITCPKRPGRESRPWVGACGQISNRKHRELLVNSEKGTTAHDLIGFFYRHSLRSELYNHFYYKFSQPRHLAGLSLASLLPVSEKPILDLACGFGHFMHYWITTHPGQRVIGLDRNFFQLYVARNWVAPGGDFICSEADLKLPFPSHGLCGVFCADAFHYFLRRWQCAEEMKRVIEPEGLIILARFGNSQAEPREGYELSVAGYLKLFDGLTWRMFSEDDLLQEVPQTTWPSAGRAIDLVGFGSPEMALSRGLREA